MGTWGPGVFENDAAEDLLDRLSSVDPRERFSILKDALSLPGVSSKFLMGQINPAEVMAGVAVVAVNVSEGDPFSGEEDYPSMRIWLDRVAGVELQSISIQAMRCIEHEFGWYWNSWVDEEEKNSALAEFERIREMISTFKH